MNDIFKLNRRDFLGKSALISTSLLFNYNRLFSQIYAFESNLKYAYLASHLGADKLNFVEGIEINSLKKIKIDTKSQAHSFVQHPKNSSIFALLTKWGNESSIIDLKQSAVIKSISAMKNSNFYGHGIYLPNGDSLLTTETNYETGMGFISIRDSINYKEIGLIDVGGAGPHDCVLSTDQKHLLVAISGVKVFNSSYTGAKEFKHNGDSHLAVIELASGKIIEKIPSPHPDLEMAHLLKCSNENIFIATASFQGIKAPAIIMTKLGGATKTLKVPANIESELKMELLSMAELQNHNMIAITCPTANLIIFWDSRSGDYMGNLKIKTPIGISPTPDGKYFAITNSQDGILKFINPKTMKLTNNKISSKVGFGSHLYLNSI